MKVGDIIDQVEITGISSKGEGVGRTDGVVVFVRGAVPGDVVKIQLRNKRKKHLEGVLKNIITPSPDRTEAACSHFENCGGCKWQHMTYEAQLGHKNKEVQETLERIGKLELPEGMPILGCESPFYYRNKLEFTFSNKRYLLSEEIQSGEDVGDRSGLGFHIAGHFDKVLAIDACHLQSELSNDIRNFIRDKSQELKLDYYDLRAHAGVMRNLIVRSNEEGQIMIILSVRELKDEVLQLLSECCSQFPQIISCYYVVNNKKNDTIFDLDLVLHQGEAALKQSIGHVSFQIGPKSFFQTNSKQALRLYEVVRDLAELNGDENLYDLYSGIGTIGSFLAKDVNKVVGVESIQEAVDDARENAASNKIENISFEAGDMAKIFDHEFHLRHGQPDIIITDPPRAGMHPKVIGELLKIKSKKLLYVSCNPSTQARDLEMLADKYSIVAYRPVDMFPHTSHVENVVLLKLKD